MICEGADRTTIDDLLLGRRVPQDLENDGLWHANQICDPVQTSTYDQAFTRRNLTFRAIQLLTGNALDGRGTQP